MNCHSHAVWVKDEKKDEKEDKEDDVRLAPWTRRVTPH